ncbi:hypothetical protein ACFOUP_12380 [Belliella kenyensis]|uniref:Uncharacterized protein n=1 Tax=Belliella kenyensis TaxID=1472724 RepID=A0ABV8ELJ0_9BACT|nr:hypothetical protein [Belliella kenyensis]MCH7400770.1 hypothetical protein [Belliella kenyensis]MDN3601942.1 hypothetical protein [Belliella kenyensis]
MKRIINEKIKEEYLNDDGKMLGGDYVYKNRKVVLNKVPKTFLREFDSLVLIERVVHLETNYSCAFFGDSMLYYLAKGLEDPQLIDLEVNTAYNPQLSIYIYEKIKKGELQDILEQSENSTIMVPPMSVFLTFVKRDGKGVSVKGYNLKVFRPLEELIKLDSIKTNIKKRSSS